MSDQHDSTEQRFGPARAGRRALSRRGRRGLVLGLAAVLLTAAGALAYFSTTGAGAAATSVGTLGAPAITSVTTGAGTVSLSWSAVSPPSGSGTVSYYVTRGGGAPAGNCPTAASPSAVTSCTDSGLTAGSYTYTVTAVWQSWSSASGPDSVSVVSGALDHFNVVAVPSATAGTPFSVTVTAEDVANNTDPYYRGTIHFTSSDGQASLPSDYTFTGSDSGSHTFSGAVTLKTAPSQTVSVKDTTQTSATGTATVSVAPAAASSLSLSAASLTPTAGAADNLTITARDPYGNVATGYTGTKNLTFGGAHTAGLFAPTVSTSSGTATSFGTPTAISFTGGVASVSGSSNGVMTLYKAETASITVSDGSINNGAGVTVTVAPASAASLSLSAASTTPTAGATDGLTITAFDAYGNTATGYTGSKNLTFSGAHSIGSHTPSVTNSSAGPVSFGTATPIIFAAGVASGSTSGASGQAVATFYDAETTNITVSDGSISNGGAPLSVTVSPASASAFSLPAPATPTAGTAFNETITAVDSYGNTATGYTGSKAVTFSGPSASPGGSAPTYPASVTFSAGTGTASITLTDAQSTSLTAAQGTLTGTSPSFTVGPAGASSFSAPTLGSQTAGVAFNLSLTALDAYGNTATGYAGSKAVTFSGPASSPNGTAPSYPASVTFTAGAGTASVTLYDAQSTTLTAAQGSLSGTSGSFTVSAGANHQIAASAASPQTAGTAFNVTLSAQDAYGNTPGTLSGTKSVSFSGPSKSPGNAAPSYPATVSFSGGTATASVTLYDAQSTTITAGDTTDGYGGVASQSLTVSAASVSAFTLPTPASPTAGTAFNESITAVDAYGNTTTGYSGSKTVTFSGPANSPNGTAPTYPAAVSFTSGVGTASIILVDAQTTTLTATQGSLTGGTTTFAVSPAANAKIVASAASPQTAGTAFNVTLSAQDAYGNVPGTLSGSKSVSFSGPSKSPGNVSPSYPATVSFSGGTATASVTLVDAQTTTIAATDTTDSYPGLASSAITVNPGSATAFSPSTPATQVAGSAFTDTITALDAYGNTATGYTGSQTITFSGPSSSPNGTAPSYPASVTFTAGVGTASVTLYDAQSTALTATQGLVTGTSGSFLVAAGANHQIVASAASPQTAGTAFSVTLTAQDAYGNVPGTLSGTKSVSFTGPSSSPSGKAPAYPSTVSFSAGTATASVTLYDAQSTTVTASDTTDGYGGVASNGIAVNAAGMASFSLQAPGSVTAGVPGTATVTALDAYGNTATGYNMTEALSFSGPSSSPNGTAPSYPASVTFVSGVASASITLYDAQSTKLTVTYGSLSASTGTFTVASGAVSTFKIPTPVSQTAGVAFSVTLTAYDAYGNGEPGYTGSQAITFSGPSSSPGGTAPSYPASVSFSSGVGTAQMTLYDAQSTSLTATQGSASGTSGSFTVLAGTTHEIGASAASPQTAGTAFNLTLKAEDTWGNPTGSLSGTKNVTFSGPASSPNGTAPSYPSSVTFSGGTATASVTLYDAQSTTITVTDTTDSYTGAASNSITVAPTATASFAVPTPETQTAGVPFSETITAIDAYGNTATSYSGSQAVSFTGPASSPNGTAPAYPSSVSFSSGVGTAQITLYDAQNTRLTATQSSLTGTSGNFTVSAGPANSFNVSNPGSATAGKRFTLTLTAYDAYGNLATGLNGAQTVAFSGPADSPTGAAPTYPASVTFIAGFAFPSITLADAQTTSITATLGSASGSTGSFTVAAGSVSMVGFAAPSVAGASSSSANLGPITVQEEDQYGNPSSTSSSLTVGLASSSAKGVFSASQFGSSITSVSLTSSAPSTTVYYGDGTVGTPTLTASASGYTSGTQQETITAAPAGLGMALASGSTGSPSISCGSVSTSYTCNVSGVGSGGSVNFYATFVDASGNPVIYSSTQASTITESGGNSGTATIAAGASSSNPNSLTASHTGGSTKTSTLTFGPYTLTIKVSS